MAKALAVAAAIEVIGARLCRRFREASSFEERALLTRPSVFEGVSNGHL